MTGVPRLLFLLVFALSMGAFYTSASVAIREIEFNRVDAQVGSNDWLECTIEVEVRYDASDSSRRRPDYVDDLDVELLLGVESSVGGQSGFELATINPATGGSP